MVRTACFCIFLTCLFFAASAESVSGGKGTIGAGEAKQIGCFKDTNAPFDLDGDLVRSTTNTPQSCIEHCRKKSFAFAGVQFGESCVCGNTYGRYGSADNCNMACSGDQT